MELKTAAVTITVALGLALAACNTVPSVQPPAPDPFIPQSFPEPALPPGANTGTAASKGYWSPTAPWPLVAIHAILMPNGNIMTFDMQGDDPSNNNWQDGSQITFNSNINLRGSWDSKLGNWRRVDIYNPRTDSHSWANNPTTDIFCSGHVLLRDGRVFVVGGHFGLPSNADGTLNPVVNTDPIPFSNNPLQIFNDSRYLGTNGFGDTVAYQTEGGGKKDTNIFDWRTNQWSRVQDMNQARWYPSATLLGNGNVLVSGGNSERGQSPDRNMAAASTLEVWNGLTYTTLQADSQDWPSYYPRTFQASNGKVFYAGLGRNMYELDVTGNQAKQFAGQRDNFFRSYGSAVMFERDKILVANGQNPPRAAGTWGASDPGNPTNTYPTSSYLIDLSAGTAAINMQNGKLVPLPDVPRGRFQENATILADGSVFVSGGNDDPNGSQNTDDVRYKVNTPILFKPNATATNGTWTAMTDMIQSRQYHSVALLMPDGRVFTAGAADCTRQGCADNSDRSHEYFWPPYLFNPDGSLARRPKIQSAPSSVTYNSRLRVSSPDAAKISKITWIRLGSVTHAFNMNQRSMSLSFARSGDTLLINAPENGNVAPPGHYMLFLINDSGVPSVARIIRIDN